MAESGLLLLVLASFSLCGARHECDRPCGDGPKHCYYHFTLGSEFQRCNNPEKEECRRRTVLSINGKSPGPFVAVCRNDSVTIDVKNGLPLGLETSLHWHGLRVEATEDGVGMITQCPILPGTTFRYRFPAKDAGTFYYRAHSVPQQLDGVFGAFVIREEDVDRVAMVAPLLDGLKTASNDVEVELTVTELRSYEYGNAESHKVRLINAAAVDCPVTVRNATMTLTALDGRAVAPAILTELLLHPGERADVLFDGRSSDHVEIIGNRLCSGYVIKGLTGEGERTSSPAEGPNIEAYRKLLRGSYTGEATVSHRAYISFDATIFEGLQNEVDFRYKLGEVTPHIPSYISSSSSPVSVYQFNNISFMYPSSPFLPRTNVIDVDFVCEFGKRARKCEKTGFCECTHVLKLPFNETVELVLIDEGKNGKTDQTIHLHGHSFHVVGMEAFERPITVDEVRRLIAGRKGSVGFIEKDTIAVPNRGFVALRFRTDKPGPWLLESVPSKAKSNMGLEMLLLVDHPNGFDNTPKNFPTCQTVKPQDLVIMDE